MVRAMRSSSIRYLNTVSYMGFARYNLMINFTFLWAKVHHLFETGKEGYVFMRMGTTTLVAFPLSHTLQATCGTLPFNEHPQNPKNPCSNKRKVTLQSFISAEPHVASNVRYIAFPLSRPPQTRSPNLVSPLSCQKNQKYPQSIILHPNNPWSNFLAGDKDEKKQRILTDPLLTITKFLYTHAFLWRKES